MLILFYRILKLRPILFMWTHLFISTVVTNIKQNDCRLPDNGISISKKKLAKTQIIPL